MSVPPQFDGDLEFDHLPRRSLSTPTFLRLVKVSQDYYRFWVPAFGLLILSTLATLLSPRIFGAAIDDAIVPKKIELIKKFALLLLGVELLRLLATIAHSYLFEKLGQQVMQGLRVKLFSHLQVLPVSTFNQVPVGRLVTRVTNDVSALADLFSAGFISLIGNVLVVIGIIASMLILDLRMGLIAVSIFPLMIAGTYYFSDQLTVAYREMRTRLSALNAFLAENILGMRVVQLFNRQSRHSERFDKINSRYADAQIGSVKVFAYFQPTITFFAGMSMSLVIYFGGVAALEGQMKLGVLVAFFTYVMSLFQPMREIADKWNILLSGVTAAERIFAIMEWPTEIDPLDCMRSIRNPGAFRGHIVFENVSFAYKADHWIIKDLSFEIKPGMRVGVVGHTGAGKTTLIHLLMRFYDPQKGRILIDGRDIRTLDKRELRSQIGVVQQDVFLFSGNLSDNIHLWSEQDDQEKPDLQKALKSLGLEEWIRGSAALQERGANLSMGQRQMVAFARVWLAKPSIWVLDEATANVDSGSEQMLETALESAAKGKTTMTIAHRLATVKRADLILVLHKGVLVQKGNHKELIEAEGLYSKLYRYQSAMETPMSYLTGVSVPE